MPASFWGPDRLLVRDGGAWRLLSWPDGGELDAGSGTPIPEPGGQRLAVVDEQGRITVGKPGTALLPPETPVREVAWDGADALLAVCGRFALRPPFNPGPTLLPVPETGCTAQRFGDHPADGMSLWRLPLEGGPPERLASADGLEQIGRPVSLGAAGFAFQHYRYPAYGAVSTQRLLRVPRAGGPPVDLEPGRASVSCSAGAAGVWTSPVGPSAATRGRHPPGTPPPRRPRMSPGSARRSCCCTAIMRRPRRSPGTPPCANTAPRPSWSSTAARGTSPRAPRTGRTWWPARWRGFRRTLASEGCQAENRSSVARCKPAPDSLGIGVAPRPDRALPPCGTRGPGSSTRRVGGGRAAPAVGDNSPPWWPARARTSVPPCLGCRCRPRDRCKAGIPPRGA